MNKNMRQNQSGKSTAYHEAGHVIAKRYFGLKIKRSTIIPKGDSLGMTTGQLATKLNLLNDYAHLVSHRIRLNVERDIIVFLAGEAAQKEFMPRSIRSHHGRSDREKAIMLLQKITGSDEEVSAYFRLLNIRAKQLMRIPLIRVQVEAIAQELLVRKTLTESEVQAVVEVAVQKADETSRAKRFKTKI